MCVLETAGVFSSCVFESGLSVFQIIIWHSARHTGLFHTMGFQTIAMLFVHLPRDFVSLSQPWSHFFFSKCFTDVSFVDKHLLMEQASAEIIPPTHPAIKELWMEPGRRDVCTHTNKSTPAQPQIFMISHTHTNMYTSLRIREHVQLKPRLIHWDHSYSTSC